MRTACHHRGVARIPSPEDGFPGHPRRNRVTSGRAGGGCRARPRRGWSRRAGSASSPPTRAVRPRARSSRRCAGSPEDPDQRQHDADPAERAGQHGGGDRLRRAAGGERRSPGRRARAAPRPISSTPVTPTPSASSTPAIVAMPPRPARGSARRIAARPPPWPLRGCCAGASRSSSGRRRPGRA